MQLTCYNAVWKKQDHCQSDNIPSVKREVGCVYAEGQGTHDVGGQINAAKCDALCYDGDGYDPTGTQVTRTYSMFMNLKSH